MNETILKEMSAAENIASTVVNEMLKNNLSSADIESVMELAKCYAVLCRNKAQRLVEKAMEQNNNPVAEGGKKHNKQDKREEPINEEVAKAADATDHMFHAFAIMEMFLAESEGRKPNMKLLEKIATRIAKAWFKDVKGVDVNQLSATINKVGKEIKVGILIPKTDEE